MTKERLVQYCELKKEIKDLEARIERIKKRKDIVSDTVQASSKSFPYVKHAEAISGVNAKKYRLLRIYNSKLNKFYDKLLVMQNEVEEYIETIDDSALRQIMRLRYIDGYGWLKIMHILDYDSESKARMKHDRFLEKNLKNF